MDKPVWEKPNPVKKSSKLSPMQKAKARARARAAGRPYPNMVDNIWAANEDFKLDRPGENYDMPMSPADKGEYDYEGQMVRTQLQTILRSSKEIIDMIADDENMPEWVQSKITLAHDYMTSVSDYLQSKKDLGEKFELSRLGSNPGKFKRLVAKHLGAKAAEKIDGADGSRIMAIARRKDDTNLFRRGSFIKNFYGEAYEEGTKEIRVAYARMTPGQTPFVLGLDKNVPQDNAIELRRRRAKKIFKAYFDEAKKFVYDNPQPHLVKMYDKKPTEDLKGMHGRWSKDHEIKTSNPSRSEDLLAVHHVLKTRGEVSGDLPKHKNLGMMRTVNEEKALGKPFRTPGEGKKFAVHVRNDKGNTVKVRFGDPNLSIKRDNPARRKSFRARHNCDNPGPRTKARYWSCRQWRAGAKVEA